VKRLELDRLLKLCEATLGSRVDSGGELAGVLDAIVQAVNESIDADAKLPDFGQARLQCAAVRAGMIHPDDGCDDRSCDACVTAAKASTPPAVPVVQTTPKGYWR
jgi:hypothetical protein